MNLERLLQLKRVLEAAPEHRLHMNAWSEKAKCGTAYCLAGWAAVDPWFRSNTEIGTIFNVDSEGYVNACRHYTTFDSLAVFFDISKGAANNLFGAGVCAADSHAVSKAEVMENLAGLIEHGHTFKYEATLDDEWENDGDWDNTDDEDEDEEDWEEMP